MDKRALIGIALSILVLVVYQQLVTHFYGPPPSAPIPETETSQTEKAVPAAPSAAAPSAALPAATPATLSPAKSAKEITVETDHYIAVFTTQGARLKSFKFKKYRSSVDEHSPPFEIVRTAPGVPLPLGVRWQAPTPFEDSEIVYSVQGNDLKLSGDGKGTLGFPGTKWQRRGHHKIFHLLRLVLSDSVRSFCENRGRNGAGPGDFTYRSERPSSA
jgi:YidC/Oxa1 family membrane protein insertase